MKENIDLIARMAFERMIEEAGEAKRPARQPSDQSTPKPAERPAERLAARPGAGVNLPVRRKRLPAALIFTAAAFLALAILPPLVVRDRPGFAELASRLPRNPELRRYAELLSDSRIQ